jgi:hypothetical protein
MVVEEAMNSCGYYWYGSDGVKMMVVAVKIMIKSWLH